MAAPGTGHGAEAQHLLAGLDRYDGNVSPRGDYIVMGETTGRMSYPSARYRAEPEYLLRRDDCDDSSPSRGNAHRNLPSSSMKRIRMLLVRSCSRSHLVPARA